MEHKYKHILSPVRLRGHILKNRIIASKCVANYLQGPQNFPTETTIRYAVDMAKHGASIVTCTIGSFPELVNEKNPHRSAINMDDRAVCREYRRMIEQIHAHGALASAPTDGFIRMESSISDIRNPAIVPPEPPSPFAPKEPIPELTKDGIERMIDNFVKCCRKVQAIGFDMINVYMSYGNSVLAKSLSPLYNQREDEYGGSLENRARLTIELMRAVKQVCGDSFLIELQVSGRENADSGYSVEDFAKYCRLFDGLADIIQVRERNVDLSHVNSYLSSKEAPLTLGYARAGKAAGLKHTLIAPSGGFQSPEYMERFLAEGSADMIAMSRGLICDDNYGKKLLEGRGKDIVPCIQCDCCHQAYCSVNPRIGISTAWPELFEAPERKKRVAVIGGGPSGLAAAIAAADRGHQVTVYEKLDKLGGQLRHAEFLPREKWSLLDYMNYQMGQVEKRQNITVLTNTEAIPDELDALDYDAVIAACGSSAITDAVPADVGIRLYAPMEVFGHEEELGHTVAVIGGGMTAVDTALYLLNSGHEVILITQKNEAGYDSNSHAAGELRKHLMNSDGITFITNSRSDRITAEGVEITQFEAPKGKFPGEDTQGPKELERKIIPYDSVVVSAGRKARTEECARFMGISPEFYVVGDANIASFKDYSDRPSSLPKSDVAARAGLRGCIFTGYTAGCRI